MQITPLVKQAQNNLAVFLAHGIQEKFIDDQKLFALEAISIESGFLQTLHLLNVVLLQKICQLYISRGEASTTGSHPDRLSEVRFTFMQSFA